MKNLFTMGFLGAFLLLTATPEAGACIGGSAVRVKVENGATILIDQDGNVTENTTGQKYTTEASNDPDLRGVVKLKKNGQFVKMVKLPPRVRSIVKRTGPCSVMDERED